MTHRALEIAGLFEDNIVGFPRLSKAYMIFIVCNAWEMFYLNENSVYFYLLLFFIYGKNPKTFQKSKGKLI